MRKFSDIEKECIKLWIDSPLGERHIVKALDPYLAYEKIFVEFDTKVAKIAHNKNDPDLSPEQFDAFMGEMVKRRDKITEIIIVVAKLIEYLEANGLVTIYQPERYKVSNFDAFGFGDDNNLSPFSPFSDSIVGELLCKYILMEIVPSEDLVQLEASKFVLPSDRKFRRTEITSWAAITIALLVPLISLVWSHYYEKDEQEFRTIFENELDKISTDINKIKSMQKESEIEINRKIEGDKYITNRIERIEEVQNKTFRNMAEIELLDRRITAIEMRK